MTIIYSHLLVDSMEQKPTKKSGVDSTKKLWYVVRALSGKEKKAKEYIEAEVAKRGWGDKIIQVLIPTEKVVSISGGKRVIKERNYYPGYVLLEAYLDDDIIPVIQNVPNVMDWLRTGKNSGAPAPMTEFEANRILGKMDEQMDTEGLMNDHYIVGETVKVIDGSLSTFSGIVEEVNEEKRKLKIAVMIFGRKTPIELNFNQVEKDTASN